MHVQAALEAVAEEESGLKRVAFGRLSMGDIIGESQCLLKQQCVVFFRADTKTRLLQIQRRDIFRVLPRLSREVCMN